MMNTSEIRYYDMDIDGLEGRFVVAKLRRVSPRLS